MVVSLNFVREDVLYKRFGFFLCCDETVPLVQYRKVKGKNAFHDYLFELWLSLWILCNKIFFITEETHTSVFKLRIFILMVIAREKILETPNKQSTSPYGVKNIWQKFKIRLSK